MHYVSTRGAAPKLGFEEAMLADSRATAVSMCRRSGHV